jgi:polycomb protein EED
MSLHQILQFFENEVNRLCCQYAVLQESAIGKGEGLAPLEHEVTLESTGKISSFASQARVTELGPIRYVDILCIETAMMSRCVENAILCGDPSNDAGCCVHRVDMSYLKELRVRTEELVKLINVAKSAFQNRNPHGGWIGWDRNGYRVSKDENVVLLDSDDSEVDLCVKCESSTAAAVVTLKTPPPQQHAYGSYDKVAQNGATLSIGESPATAIDLVQSSSEDDKLGPRRRKVNGLKKTATPVASRSSKKRRLLQLGAVRIIETNGTDNERREPRNEIQLEAPSIPQRLLNAVFDAPTHEDAASRSTKEGTKFRYIANAGTLRQRHRNPIFCATWSTDYHYIYPQAADPKQDQETELTIVRSLATCSGPFTNLYHIHMTNDRRGARSGPFILHQSYSSESFPGEDLYSCVFAGRSEPLESIGVDLDDSSDDNQGTPSRPYTGKTPQLLCVGGKLRRIYVFDTVRHKCIYTLHGHGEDIQDLKRCPTDEWILMSSSVDKSIRLWNLKTGDPVAILAGREGHKDGVVSVGWHASGNRIVSSGLDNAVKIWGAGDGSLLNDAIAESHKNADCIRRGKPGWQLKPVKVDTPLFSTIEMLHIHYVDCVQFVGNLVLSKSVDSVIELWSPTLPPTDLSPPTTPVGDLVHLKTFQYEGGTSWFMRFATDPLHQRLAVGNVHGELYVWTIDAKTRAPDRILTSTGRMTSTIRWVEFSPCGNTVVATMEDGSLYKWDVGRS